MKCEINVITLFKVFMVALSLLIFAVPSQAATLKTQFINEDGDRICVYEKHFHEVYVNVGFSGHCSFNVPDSEL